METLQRASCSVPAGPLRSRSAASGPTRPGVGVTSGWACRRLRGDRDERDGRRFTERSSRTEFRLCHGNPMLGDPEVADAFFSEDGSLWFLKRADRWEVKSTWMGSMGCGAGGAVMRIDFRRDSVSFGPDFRDFPSEVWGRRDWAMVEMKYQPLGKMPLAPAPARALPPGFRLFPGQRAPAPETKGERAVREIRAKLGSR